MIANNVTLSPIIHDTILRSAIEVFPNESSGRLFAQGTDEMRVVSAYPLQTTKRTPTMVDEGNKSAVKRLDQLDRALLGPSVKVNGATRLVGGYHSHPWKRALLAISPGDIEQARIELGKRDLGNWIEIIARLSRTTYEFPAEPGVSTRTYSWISRTVVRLSEYAGYEVSIGAFEVSRDGSYRKIPLRVDQTHLNGKGIH